MFGRIGLIRSIGRSCNSLHTTAGYSFSVSFGAFFFCVLCIACAFTAIKRSERVSALMKVVVVGFFHGAVPRIPRPSMSISRCFVSSSR
jgi:uncharacterized membrane protein YczE